MSDAAEIVIDTIGGRTFRASRRTWAHLEWTVEQLAHDAPTCSLRVIQGAFNTGVKASAGTHDYDACLDVQIIGMEWSNAQGFLRRCGWAAWYRTPAQGFTPHIHMVSIGYPGQVGVYVPGQVRDYYAHRTGLVGHAADPSWYPRDIDSTVFDYDAYESELHMDDAKFLELAKQAVREVLNETVDVEKNGAKKKRSPVQMIRELWQRS